MNEMPNLIQNGYFGNNQPMGGYNPYQQPMMSNFMPPPQPMQSNIIPIGSYNYNSTAFNPYNNTQQQYTFQPVNGGYDPMAQYRAQQQGSYYSPYPQYQQPYILQQPMPVMTPGTVQYKMPYGQPMIIQGRQNNNNNNVVNNAPKTIIVKENRK